MENVSVNNRSSSIDLFKFLSMFMVVILHTLGHGGVLNNTHPLTISWFALYGLETLCIVAVNCFALITGFLNAEKTIKLKNLLNLWLQVFFYTVTITCLFMILKQEPFSIKTLVLSFFPVTSKQYWYFSSYFILFLSMPLLNLILKNATKKFLLLSLVCASILFGIVNYLASHLGNDIFGINSGYGFLWLAVLYLIGGYVKKYSPSIKIKSKPVKPMFYLFIYFISSIMNMCCGFILSYLTEYRNSPFISTYSFILNIISSVALLMFFTKIQIKQNKFLSFLAKTSFGVYLIHEQQIIRKLFITNKFTFLLDYNILITLLGVLAIACVIYITCTIIEFIRQNLFNLIKVNKITEYVQKTTYRLYDKIKIDDKGEQL